MKDIFDCIYKKRETTDKLSLDRIKELLKYMGNPQDKLKYIHIAGTNGKGSITTTLSNILIQSGYKVGKAVSPYVDNFFERIQINNIYIEEMEVRDILSKIEPFIDKMEDKPSPFEIIAAISFEYFYINKCDIVCLEVGLGGRFDATNCITNTLISIISVIDYDHMNFLGNTLEEIAFEKCGIIKEGKITITYPLQKEKAYKMIRQMADIRNNRFIDINVNQLTNIQKVGFNYMFEYKGLNYELGLNGKHQIYNTLVVIEAVEELVQLGFSITYENMYNAIKNTSFIGRLQVIREDPFVILDGAHNISGAKALRDFILDNNKNRKIVLIVSIKEGKEVDNFFAHIANLCDNIIITRVNDNVIKSVDVNEMFKKASIYNKNIEIELSHERALRKAIEFCDKEDIVLISGSLYLVSEFYNKV